MTEKTIDLAELLFELSPLNRRHAELLSERWAKDVIQELQDTGVSVISGLGTLSAGLDGITFQLDKDLPIAPELPGVEGFSETGALAHAALIASIHHVHPESGPSLSDGTSQAPEVPVVSESSSTVTPEPEPGLSSNVEETSTDEDSLTEPQTSDESTDEAAPLPPEPTGSKPSSDSPSSRLAPDNAPIPGGASSDDSSKKTIKSDTSDQETNQPTTAKEAAARRREASARIPSRGGRRRAGVGAHRNQQDRGGLIIAAGLLVVLIISIVAVWAIRPSDDSMSTDPITAAEAQESAEVNVGDLDVDSGRDIDKNLSTDETEGNPEAPASTAPSESDESGSAVYQEITADTPGYMLVVGSSLELQGAQQSLTQFANLGVPLGVIAYEEDGITRYRMGVGIYETAAIADEARIKLSEELPEGTWVKRIR